MVVDRLKFLEKLMKASHVSRFKRRIISYHIISLIWSKLSCFTVVSQRFYLFQACKQARRKRIHFTSYLCTVCLLDRYVDSKPTIDVHFCLTTRCFTDFAVRCHSLYRNDLRGVQATSVGHDGSLRRAEFMSRWAGKRLEQRLRERQSAELLQRYCSATRECHR